MATTTAKKMPSAAMALLRALRGVFGVLVDQEDCAAPAAPLSALDHALILNEPWQVWQLADDAETYGAHAGWYIITTAGGEHEIAGGPWQTTAVPERIVQDHNTAVLASREQQAMPIAQARERVASRRRLTTPSNSDRADGVDGVLSEYCEDPDADARTKLVDFLSDALHWAKREEVDMIECQRMARIHFEHEQ